MVGAPTGAIGAPAHASVRESTRTMPYGTPTATPDASRR
jgi:hypothetical protein